MRIAEIDRPMRVLSWNQKSQQFQLSLSGGGYQRGKSNLYRIATRRGEFVSTLHHRLFSYQGTYVPAGQAYADGIGVKQARVNLRETTWALSRQSSHADDPHSSQTVANLMGSYAAAARQYGQRLQSDQDSALASAPLPGDARKLFRNFSTPFAAHTGVLAALKPLHSRLGQFFSRCKMTDYAPPCAALAGASVGQISSLSSEHTSHYHPKSPLSRLTFFGRHIAEKFSLVCRVLNPSQAYKSPVLVEEPIISLSESDSNAVYWDMQVLDTSNYVCEHGFIHHNSGKSEAAIIRIIILMLENYAKTKEPIDCLITFPTYDLCNLRGMSGIQDIMDRCGISYVTNKSNYSVTINPFGTVLFRSYDRPERIVAFQISHAILDELDTLPKEKASFVWRKVVERTRQHNYKPNSVAVVTTPDQGTNGFTYAKWGNNPQPGYELIEAPTASNPYLPDGYVAQIRANYDPILAELYLSGKFVSLNTTRVYHQFNRKAQHVAREIHPGERLHIGLDFNVSGTCACVFVMADKGAVAVDEFVSHDTADFCIKLSRYAGHEITVYPDASGAARRTNASQSDIQMIRQAGIEVDAPKMNPAIRDRINAVNALLSHNELLINCDKCPETAHAFETQGYDKNGEPEKFDSHPSLDDRCDAAGYFLHRRFPISRPIFHSGLSMLR